MKTTEDLLESIRRQSFVPSGQQTYSPSEILKMASEEMITWILPSIVRTREEYFIHSLKVTLQRDNPVCPIPDRAIGMSLRDIFNPGDLRKKITKLDEVEIIEDMSGTPRYYYIKNNDIVFYPKPDSPTVVQINFPMLPSSFVQMKECAKVVLINGNTVEVDQLPAGWYTGMLLDVVKYGGGQEAIVINESANNIASPEITFNNPIPNLKVGDYICKAETTCLIQLPQEYRVVLSQLTAAAIQEGMNLPNATKTREKAMASLQAAERLISPRASKDLQIIKSPWM